MDVYLLDSNLQQIHIVDTYESLIWADRYNELGDCELALPASVDILKKIRGSAYIVKTDSDMLCRIEKVELQTDVENGDILIVTGIDIKKILYQRIIAQQTIFNGTAENYIRKLITDNIINPSNEKRKINDFILDSAAGFEQEIEQQVSWDNLGEKIQELCKTHQWGFKVGLNENKKFVFSLYEGTDRTTSVIFSDEYENISTTDYVKDSTNIMTTGMVVGEGEGVNRLVQEVGDLASGLNRYELYVDGSNISKSIDYGELQSAYPGGTEVEEGGVLYYRVNGKNIAILTRTSTSISAKLTDEIYAKSLSSQGIEDLAEYGEVTSFEGSIEPNRNFIYKHDYFLGDIVTIINEYGIEIESRITEVIEVDDVNGHSTEVKFEYLNVQSDDTPYIFTEDGEKLMTENYNYLVLEKED